LILILLTYEYKNGVSTSKYLRIQFTLDFLAYSVEVLLN
jgi:hypothetical protein